MIVRVLTATVKAERAATFNALLRQQLPVLRECDGLRYVKLARRLNGATEEIVLFEEWREPRALYAWAGIELDRPRLLPGAEDMVDTLSIAHYEALDIEPDTPEPA